MALVAILALSSNCASIHRAVSGPERIGPGNSHPPTGRALDRATAAARLRFDSAARIGDTVAMAALFADDAIVVVAPGDTIRGREAVAKRILALDPVPGARVYLYPRRTVECVDGAYEFGGEYAAREPEGTTRREVRGDYALRWTYAPASGMRVQALVLHGSTHHDEARARRLVSCTPAHVQQFAARRFQLSMSAPQTAVGASMADRSLARGLEQQGYRTHIFRDVDGVEKVAQGAAFEEAGSAAAVTLRWYPLPGVSVQAFAPFARSETVVRGYDEPRSAEIVIGHSARSVGALASLEWRRLRLGTGPLLLLNDWTVREERVVALRYADFEGYLREGVVESHAWKTTSVALVTELGYTYPISHRVFADVRFHARTLAGGETRATPAYQAAEVELGGYAAALGFGLAF